MLVPVKIFIPDYQEPIQLFEGRLVIRKISDQELQVIFGVKVLFEFQRVVKIIENYPERKISPYERLYSPDHLAFHVDPDFLDFPYFVIEADTSEIASDLLFLLRILKTDHLLAPFGFEENLTSISIFYPTITTTKFSDYLYELDKDTLVDLIVLINNKSNNPQYRMIKERYLNTLDSHMSDKLKYLEWAQITESIILSQNSKDNVTARFKSQFKKNIQGISGALASKIYDNRCSLAHSGKLTHDVSDSSKEYSLCKLHLHTQEIIRSYIKDKIVVENQNFSKILS